MKYKADGDLISRQAVIDAIYDMEILKYRIDLEKVIKALPPVAIPHDRDLISRQTVLDVIVDVIKQSVSQYGNQYTSDMFNMWGLFTHLINELPTVAIPSAEPKKCKDCKWWRDSDGSFSRGCWAESKCPINTKTVYDGNGYCYMFEPQENETR